MYERIGAEKKYYSAEMDALKSLNRIQKELLSSKEYKIGMFLKSLKESIRSKEVRKTTIKWIRNAIRWKRLCNKYPINTIDVSIPEADYFSNQKIIVYTSIFGKYDIPQEPLFCPDNCEFFILTDQKILPNTKWKKVNTEHVIPNFEELSNVEKNRYCKMMPFELFPEADYTIYIDGNIRVITDLTELVNRCGDYGMAFHAHKARKCVYDEVEACKIMGKANPRDLEELKTYLLHSGFPKDYGMLECNAIVRNNTCKIMQKVMKEWWAEFLKHDAKRDQLTLPFVLWNNSIVVSDLCTLGSNIDLNDSLFISPHA